MTNTVAHHWNPTFAGNFGPRKCCVADLIPTSGSVKRCYQNCRFFSYIHMCMLLFYSCASKKAPTNDGACGEKASKKAKRAETKRTTEAKSERCKRCALYQYAYTTSGVAYFYTPAGRARFFFFPPHHSQTKSSGVELKLFILQLIHFYQRFGAATWNMCDEEKNQV